MAVGPRANPDWFNRALWSMLDQTFGGVEVIVILDGFDRLRFDCSQGRLRAYRQEHAGLAASLNRAACLARGQLYARMDADDIALPRRLERQVEAMRGLDVLGTWAHEYGTTNGVMRYPVGHADILAELPRRNPFCHSTILMRREMFWRVGGYEGGRGQDWRLWRRMAKAGASFGNVPEPLLYYRRHPGQASAGLTGRLAALRGRIRMLGVAEPQGR